MKHAKLLVIGFWSSLFVLPAVADDSGNTASENASGNQEQENAGTVPSGAGGGAPKAATTKGQGRT